MEVLKRFLVIVLFLIFAGELNASIVEISVATDKPIYQLGEYVTVSITAYNPTSETVILGFPTTLQASYLLDGTFDWANRPCLQIPSGRIIDAYDSYTWNLNHGSGEMAFYPLAVGIHSVVGEVIGYGFSEPIQFEVVPEPGTLLLLALGAVGQRFI